MVAANAAAETTAYHMPHSWQIQRPRNIWSTRDFLRSPERFARYILSVNDSGYEYKDGSGIFCISHSYLIYSRDVSSYGCLTYRVTYRVCLVKRS